MSQDLARRAVACPRWPRIRSDGSYRTMNGVLTFREHDTGRLWIDVGGISHDWLPDLDDPATVGCLLALVREVWGDPVLHVQWSWTWSGWYVYGAHPRLPGLLGRHDSEAAALVAALEAA